MHSSLLTHMHKKQVHRLDTVAREHLLQNRSDAHAAPHYIMVRNHEYATKSSTQKQHSTKYVHHFKRHLSTSPKRRASNTAMLSSRSHASRNSETFGCDRLRAESVVYLCDLHPLIFSRLAWVLECNMWWMICRNRCNSQSKQIIS